MRDIRTAEPIIWFDNVTLGYGSEIVLKDLNFIEYDLVSTQGITGQSICFVGRSGRGKSTLFKALSGLMEPLSGNIILDIDGNHRKVKEGDVGFVDQKYTLFRHKTIFEILHYAMRKLKVGNKKEQIDQSLMDWNLFDHKDKYPNELSGGQRQRVAILEKLLSLNHYIIMDEPISGLDVVSVNSVKQNFRKVLSTHDMNTIIFSTHDIDFAVEMADIIYVIGHTPEDKKSSTIISKYNLINGDLDVIKMSIISDLEKS